MWTSTWTTLIAIAFARLLYTFMILTCSSIRLTDALNPHYSHPRPNFLRPVSRSQPIFAKGSSESYDQDKFPARRGLRPAILDPSLVATYHAVQDTSVISASDRLTIAWRGQLCIASSMPRSIRKYDSKKWLRPASTSTTLGVKGGVGLTETSEPPPWPEGLTCTTNA